MARDKILPLIPDDGGFDIPGYNAELEILEETSKRTWFTAPWLFAECVHEILIFVVELPSRD